MNRDRFIKNITDQIVESQIKLGYAKETVRLYYPVDSLNALLDSNAADENEMLQILEKLFVNETCELGNLIFDSHKGRIEICVPPKGVEYIYENVEKTGFLVDMIQLFQYNHRLEIEDIKRLFEKYDSKYICEKMPEDSDFDYALHFEDSRTDDYFYCIKMEMGHTIYHRFTREDYRHLFGS